MSDQTTPEVRRFHIGDLLSITTGRFVSPNGVGSLYELLDYMTGDSLFTHQLPRAGDECGPALLRQHPDLAAVAFPAGWDEAPPELMAKFVTTWLAAQVVRFGETLPVTPLAQGEHVHINPLLELIQVRGNREGDSALKQAVDQAVDRLTSLHQPE